MTDLAGKTSTGSVAAAITTAEAFATEITNRSTAIAVGASRAEAAEALLATSSALSTETTHRIAADTTNAAISTETRRAEAAEALLAPKAPPTFTGTVSEIIDAMVGADASGLAATEQTRALAAEAWLLPLAGGTMTGALLLNGVSETPRFG
ncbi:MAG TPA: hypothetical protein VN901_13715 [Candidatus Acidoferrales bacterium]|nr:hypothetical protein [Candidatus Acidoferrales bacterium]